MDNNNTNTYYYILALKKIQMKAPVHTGGLTMTEA